MGALVSVFVHAALLAVVIFFSSRPRELLKEDAEVKFFAVAAAAAPAAPAAPAHAAPTPVRTAPKIEKKLIKTPEQIIQPKEIPTEKPKEAEPEPESAAEETGPEASGPVGPAPGGPDSAGDSSGRSGPGGTQVGGPLGGGGSAQEVLAFGEGMSRPVGDRANQQPRYTREALEARIEGLMLVKCTITIEGELKNCRVIKPLPHMERAVLDALAKWKFAPATFQGHPVTVDYVIPVRLVIPR